MLHGKSPGKVRGVTPRRFSGAVMYAADPELLKVIGKLEHTIARSVLSFFAPSNSPLHLSLAPSGAQHDISTCWSQSNTIFAPRYRE
jgi:hypothetical protein